jgi:acyl carrier protein
VTTESRVIALLARVLQAPAGAVHGGSTRETVEGWDSLGHMSVCLALEEEFGVSFTDEHVTSMQGVADVVRIVETLGAASARRI